MLYGMILTAVLLAGFKIGRLDRDLDRRFRAVQDLLWLHEQDRELDRFCMDREDREEREHEDD